MPRDDPPVVKRHVAAKRCINLVATNVGSQDLCGRPTKGGVCGGVIRVAWRRAEKGNPVRIGDVVAAGEPDACTVDGSDGAPVVVVVPRL